jgi:hypothetical protein
MNAGLWSTRLPLACFEEDITKSSTIPVRHPFVQSFLKKIRGTEGVPLFARRGP